MKQNNQTAKLWLRIYHDILKIQISPNAPNFFHLISVIILWDFTFGYDMCNRGAQEIRVPFFLVANWKPWVKSQIEWPILLCPKSSSDVKVFQKTLHQNEYCTQVHTYTMKTRTGSICVLKSGLNSCVIWLNLFSQSGFPGYRTDTGYKNHRTVHSWKMQEISYHQWVKALIIAVLNLMLILKNLFGSGILQQAKLKWKREHLKN